VLLLFIDLLLYSHKADRQGILNKNERKVIYYPLGLIVVERELFTHPKELNSSSVIRGARVARYLIFV
jgi:hypothetical protein